MADYGEFNNSFTRPAPSNTELDARLRGAEKTLAKIVEDYYADKTPPVDSTVVGLNALVEQLRARVVTLERNLRDEQETAARNTIYWEKKVTHLEEVVTSLEEEKQALQDELDDQNHDLITKETEIGELQTRLDNIREQAW